MSNTLIAAHEGYIYPNDKDRAKWSAMAKEAKRLGFAWIAAELLAASKKPKNMAIRRDVKATWDKFYSDLKLTP